MNERPISPNDVPGRLLNMSLLNIGSDDPNLRLAAYNLLYSLSLTFRFDIGNQLLNARGKPFQVRRKRSLCSYLVVFARSLHSCQ